MTSNEAVAVLACAALTASWLYLKPGIPFTSLGWATLFGILIFRSQLWSVIKVVASRAPWPVTIISTTISLYCVFRMVESISSSETNNRVKDDVDALDDLSVWGGLTPLIFPARTTHTRLFPKRHAFSYSYLLVGIPIGWRGTVGSFLSADVPLEDLLHKPVIKRPWLSINSGDYLERGGENLGLRDKLHAYLQSQEGDYQDYPYAYLVTAPRFLGYSFNPVSFWYLYNERKELRAMVLEVNNTFDERRMYFLKSSGPEDLRDWEILPDTAPGRFKDTWAKDFHVSPFNSRKGSYALSALDPFSPHLTGLGKIDNTITLISSKAHAKLIARIFSTNPSIDPTKLAYWGRLRFIASWWWVGFVTVPRIVKEAGKLFFGRKLHVWFRPEVLKDSVGRHATSDEIIIERTFRSFLSCLVKSSNLDKSIRYTSSIAALSSSSKDEVFTSSFGNATSHTPQWDIELKITTPLFYARLARSSHISEFLSGEILKDDDKDRTFYISDPKSFLRLFEGKEAIEANGASASLSRTSSTRDLLAWSFLELLRNYSRRPMQQSRERDQIDIRHFTFSDLDRFAMTHEKPEQARQYRSVVTKSLLSDIVAFGHPEILDAVGFISKVVFSYLFVLGLKLILARDSA